jgi:hypothetical protein
MFRRGTVSSETLFLGLKRVSVRRYRFRDTEANGITERTECLRYSFTDAVVDFVLTALETN